MRNYKEEIVTVHHLESITCDICGMKSNNPHNGEMDYFTTIPIPFGYFSVFGDVELDVTLDVCQHCLLKMIPEHVIVDEIQSVVEQEE